MSRHLAPVIILAAILAPISAHAQVNIDQDKTPAHIFASDCSVCHKTTRGLANGRGNSALTGFLSEHYTSSREEAASVAAYVLSAGGGVGTATPVRGEQKPDSARAPAGGGGQTRVPSRSLKRGGRRASTASPRRSAALQSNRARPRRKKSRPIGIARQDRRALMTSLSPRRPLHPSRHPQR